MMNEKKHNIAKNGNFTKLHSVWPVANELIVLSIAQSSILHFFFLLFRYLIDDHRLRCNPTYSSSHVRARGAI